MRQDETCFHEIDLPSTLRLHIARGHTIFTDIDIHGLVLYYQQYEFKTIYLNGPLFSASKSDGWTLTNDQVSAKFSMGWVGGELA